VNADTRARVETAIAEMHYVPNVLARSFRSKRTNTLGLILTDITNPFWTRVARGVEDTARAAGYSLILTNTDENEAIQQETVELFLQKQVDGILLVPRRNGADLVARIRRQGVAVVILDRRISGIAVDSVRGDSEQGAYLLTHHLLGLGHRHIVVISGPADVPTSIDRVAGFRRAMQEAGPAAIGEVYYGEYSHASGYAETHRVLAGLSLPSAIFAGNNLIATGALHAAQEFGLRVPQDLSLVCFDDFPIELLVSPFFTTADQPAYELGCQATQLLLDRLNGAEDDEPREIIMPVEIILRKSSAPPLH
jgi:LacI family transcriptional regulator